MGWQQRIERGESAALEELYDRASGRVYRIAVVMTASGLAAEQVTEAVFLEIWSHPQVLVSHQHDLDDYLTHLACQRGARWQAQHRVADPTHSPRRRMLAGLINNSTLPGMSWR